MFGAGDPASTNPLDTRPLLWMSVYDRPSPEDHLMAKTKSPEKPSVKTAPAGNAEEMPPPLVWPPRGRICWSAPSSC